MLRNTLFCSGIAALLLASPVLMAKTITLYDQPSDTAKTIGKIDTEVGFVPIFTQKDGKWTKVGDPANGNTGWVKAADLSAAAGSSQGYSFSQSMVSKGNGTPSMVVRFGTPKPMTDKETQAFLAQSWQQQQALQRDIQNMMQQFYNTQPGWMGYPMVLPVMVVPVQQLPAATGAGSKK